MRNRLGKYYKLTRCTILSFALCIVSIPVMLNAQYMEIANKNELIIDSYFYNYSKSGHFFNGVPEGMIAFNKSLKSYKTGKDFGYIGVGALSVGIALIAIDQHQGSCDFICLTTGQVIGIFSVFLVFPLAGTIGLVTTWSGKRHMKDAVRRYNEHYGLDQSKGDDIGLSFGITPNGLGFVINF